MSMLAIIALFSVVAISLALVGICLSESYILRQKRSD
jgi:hypothetical protein